MAKKERKPKTVVYFRSSADGSTDSVQKMLISACKKLHEADRQWSPTEGSDERRVISDSMNWGKCFCGTFVKYEEGMHQHLFVPPEKITKKSKKGRKKKVIEHSGRAESAKVSASEEGYRREVIKGALYFAVLGDHLAIAQSIPLKGSDLAEHIEWLLQKAKKISEGSPVLISNEITNKMKDVITRSPLQSMEIGGNIRAFTGKTQDADGKDAAHSYTILNPSWIDQLTKNNKNLRQKIEEGGGLDHVQCTVIIKVPKRKAEDSEDLIKQMALNLEGENFEKTHFKLADGNKYSGETLIVSCAIPTDFYDGVIRKEDIYGNLANWLEEQVKTGNVPA